jgi:uncharacterized protein (DUF2236 family)
MAPALSQRLKRPFETGLSRLIQPEGTGPDDFRWPAGEPALLAPSSVSWRVFKNPVSLFVGGVAAVLLELAEPGVRSGVWTHSTFRTHPLDRLRRTGYAAMMTVYGPRSRTEAMIAGITRRHAQVQGHTPDGRPYRATDPDLLDWVHATASFGFLEAYHLYVAPVSAAGRDTFYGEGQAAAVLYGALSAPRSQAGMDALFARMSGRLAPSPILHEFLHIVRRMPALPVMLRPLQGLLVDAAVTVVPAPLRDRLDLGGARRLSAWQRGFVLRAGAAMERLVLVNHPAVQASRRLGLPDDYLFRG